MTPPRSFGRLARGAAVFAAAVPFAMCAPAPAYLMQAPASGPSYVSLTSTAPEVQNRAVSEHVIVISIDGLRADAIERADAETLQRLMREGAYSLEARTILPSITLPSHTSMLTGATPAMHGVDWNDERVEEEGVIQTPTMFAIARKAGYHTAAFFSKPKFQHLMAPGTLDYGQAPEGNGRWYAGYTAESVERYLEDHRPNLLFVHFGEPDYAGHTIGWGTFVYRWAVRRADGAAERVLRKADEAFGEGNYTVIVTADHGGHGRTHGTDAESDVTIPWIAWGKGVKPGVELPEGIRTFDTAATALGLLGLSLPPEHAGTPVRAAFTEPIATPAYAGAAQEIPVVLPESTAVAASE
ncbi:MAG TPA: ectonucleotide pyrophosphatase/phosphodiesterase [Longimicrobiaceae bacterium]